MIYTISILFVKHIKELYAHHIQ